jgi:DNA repair protein RadC
LAGPLNNDPRIKKAKISSGSRASASFAPDLHDPVSERKSTAETWERRMEIIAAELAYLTLKDLMTSEVEEFWALALGPTKTVLRNKMIFRGTVDACLVHPRDIFRFACLENASSLIVAHNHPSGDSRPSEQDLVFTNQLLEAACIIEIPILDHLIITRTGFSSFAREGWCGFAESRASLRNVHAR